MMINELEVPKRTLKKVVICAVVSSLVFCGFSLQVKSYASSVSSSKPVASVDLRFPGKVAADATREKATTVLVKTHLNDYQYLNACSPENWQSTGLYAAPGEVITVTLPEAIEGLKVQIGSHLDQLEDIKPSERLRAPIITVEKDLVKGETKLSNPYGGLIYIKPTLYSAAKPTTKVVIKNAIKAPTYILGVTTDTQWQQMVSNPKVPMGELISGKVILTVPSKYLKDVNDPQKLMQTWNEIVDFENTLAGLDENQNLLNRAPQEPWRYVADIQISWGYMYAGYPIMLFDEPCIKDMLSVEGLKNNGWGFYHEMGHNYQQDKWTPESLIEVSCNIFSLFIQEKYGRPSELYVDNADTGQSSFKDAIKFVTSNQNGKNFNDESQVHVFTRLVMFWQLKETYGWELYPNLFKTMRATPISDEVEQEDQDKMELMAETLCKITGDDLTPFFEHWGINLRQPSKDRISKLGLKPLTKEIWLLSR